MKTKYLGHANTNSMPGEKAPGQDKLKKKKKPPRKKRTK